MSNHDPNTAATCQDVDDAMADLLDGSAGDALYQHLERCDRCRDARHEAQQAASLVADAGSDYNHPEDFAERLTARLDAGEGQLGAESAEASELSLHDEAISAPVPAGKTQPMTAVTAPVTSSQQLSQVAAATAGNSVVTPLRQRGLRGWLRRPRNTALVALGAAALAAAAVTLAVRPATNEVEGPLVANGWHGKVADVRSVGKDGGGLSVCDSVGQGCKPLLAGMAVGPGQQLRTDPRTRAHMDMADGSKMALDRDTVLTLSGEGGRRATLSSGAIVAEVAKQEERPVWIGLPRGHVEVLGTKFALRAMGKVAAVDVSRGSVKLVDDESRAVQVRAGEEGRSYPGVPPYASAAPSLSQALAWSESAEPEAAQEALRGLGELRAKKPGSKEERQGAVRLAKHQVKVRISGGFARTEVDEVFQNDADEVLEGIYRFPLPPDAHIERLALEVDGKMEEGAFVSRERAAAIWRGAIVNGNRQAPRPVEEIIWVPGPWKDPALLEWQRGGRFELRIFPIPKRGSRRVVLAYTQPVAATSGVRRYVYPLAHDAGGSTNVDEFSLDVQVRGYDRELGVRTAGYSMASSQAGGAEQLSLSERGFTPRGDLVVEYAALDHDREMTAWAYQPVANSADAVDKSGKPSASADTAKADKPTRLDPPAGSLVTVNADDPYVAIALRPKLPGAGEQQQRTFAFVVDASRSMYGERYKRASELTARVVAELDRLDRFTVLACDTTCQPLSGGLRAPSFDAAREVSAFLDSVSAEGASDPAANIRDAVAHVSAAPSGSLRLVYIGDGTPTVGPIQGADLARAASDALGSRGTLTTVAIGTDADADALRALSRGGGGALVPYAPGQTLGEVAYSVLGAAYGAGLRDVQVELPPGLEALAPQQLDTIVAGGEALLTARMTRPSVSGTIVVRGKVGDQSFERKYPLTVAASSDSAHAFVPRLYAAARIADLEQRGDAEARREAVDLSGRFNVASRYTSLLVLESPAMFKAFGLDNVRTVAEWTGEEQLRGASGDAQDADEDSFGSSSRSAGAKKAKDAAARNADDLSMSGSAPGGGGVAADEPVNGAAAAPVATMAPAQMSPPKARPHDKPSGVESLEAELSESKRESRPWRDRGRRMVPMRRIFERQLNVDVNKVTPSAASGDKIAAAERALTDNPNRRAALAELFKLYSQADRVDQAAQLAERWSDKEALDPEALTARADIAARRGNRELAIRILGSVVDVRPGNTAAHKRLARLHRWAGREALGCRHSIAVSQMQPDDVGLLVDAAFCARQTGESVLAQQMLSRSIDSVRRQAEQLLANKKVETDTLRGELKVTASWEGGGNDLDLALIHPDGHWVSWLGAPTSELISAQDVTSSHREGLALMGTRSGEYVIEVVRAAGSGPVRGKVEIRGPGALQTIPFVLEGDRLALGTARVSFRSRLVPVRGGWNR